jgi:16S rRNA (guanine527-N7)-methyltransferase
VSLIDLSRKKISFLKHIKRVLELGGMNIFHGKIEELGKDPDITFDIIVSRATFKIKEFLKISCPYINKNGRLVLSKGPAVSDEIDSLNDNIKNHIVQNVSLQFSGNRRNLLVLSCHPSSMEN